MDHFPPQKAVSRLAIAIALLTVSAPALADSQRISLGETLEVAVRQSPTLADAEIDVDVADARLGASLGGEDWLLAARLSFLINRDEAESGNITGTDKIDRYAAETTLSKLLKTGGTVGVRANGSYQSSFFEQFDAENVTYETAIEAFVNQPLLRGRGEAIARQQARTAKTELTAAEMSKRAAAQALVRDVIDSYWQLALAHRALAIRQSSLELARERRRLTDASVSAGQVARTELDAVDQIIATRQEEILAAELVISERAIELRRRAGLEIGAGAIDLEPTAELVAPERTLDANAIIEQAFAASPELKILEARGEGARIQVEVAENGLLPRLDISLQGGPIGTDSTASGSVSNLVRFKGYQVSGALDFSYELGKTGATGNSRAARAGLRAITVSVRDIKAQLSVAAVRAVKQAENAAARIAISKQVIALAEKNVKAEQARFELGRTTNFDILERQEELKQANLRLAQATADYLRALNVIDELSGALLERSGIKLGK